MTADNSIRYLTGDRVDRARWDAAVNAAPNGLIYLQSFFLDCCCDWDALVLGDYRYLMPLPRRRKAGFSYIYTPAFAAQLGIVGPTTVDAELCEAFLQAIPAGFSYVDLLLNEDNALRPRPGLQLQWRTNLVLPLRDDYGSLQAAYSADARKNLRRARGLDLAPAGSVSPQKVVELYRAAYGHLNRRSTEKDYAIFLQLAELALARSQGLTLGVVDEKGELLAAAFFGRDEKRLYYLLGAPTDAGRRRKAIHFLLDGLIRQFAGSGLSLDFEGSDISSVAAFYRKFQPRQKAFAHIRLNRLPWLLRWLKK